LRESELSCVCREETWHKSLFHASLGSELVNAEECARSENRGP